MSGPQPKKPFDLLNKKKNLAAQMYNMPSKITLAKPAATTLRPSVASGPKPASQVKFSKNGLPKINGTPRKSLTPSRSSSRQASSEPRESARNGKTVKPKRPSPTVSTPQWASDEDEESESRRKRVRLDRPDEVDHGRIVRDPASFSDDSTSYNVIHAADIANSNIQQHGRYQFGEYFSALQGDEEECPTIHLQYPCGSLTEKYQLVKPTDRSDFKPLSEIQDNMKMVAEFYLDGASRELIDPPDFGGGGLVGKLGKSAKDSARAGAQQRFIDVVDEYNKLLCKKRKDGTISSKLDKLTSPLPLKLVQHIVKDQIYARTVSPEVDIVREYEGFSDNVYGELLPKFLSTIFRETHLKSNQVFVDLGSGVGNCVLQAALEIGCEAWGCEVMKNPAKLAGKQAEEFPSRCKMWGIKPGKVRLIEDDFTKNTELRATLKRADVVLVNNQAFTAELNDTLKYIFLDLKEGCQIVSLKYFRDPVHRIEARNINDPANILRVVEKERFSGMVSWSDDPGKWYLHVKDTTELKAVQKQIET